MKEYFDARIMLLAGFMLLTLVGCGNKEIGKIQGAEWDTIIIDDVEYSKTTSSDFSISDKDDYLGTVTDGGNTVFKVYSVKGDTEGRYIYCLWDWEGSIYEKKTG